VSLRPSGSQGNTDREKEGERGNAHLHQENILGALSLNLWVLDLHGHRLSIMQHSLVDLGQGGCSQRGVIKAQEQVVDLSGWREDK
jgi:hypothetical protein